MCSSKVSFCFKLIAVLLVVVTLVTLIPKNLTAHVLAYESLPESAGLITPEDAEQYSIISRDRASEIDFSLEELAEKVFEAVRNKVAEYEAMLKQFSNSVAREAMRVYNKIKNLVETIVESAIQVIELILESLIQTLPIVILAIIVLLALVAMAPVLV